MDPDVARVSNLILRVTDFVLRPWYRWCGLNRLAARYPAPEQAPDSLLTRQACQLQGIRWRGVVTLGVLAGGLYLQVATAPAALIPWEQVRDLGPARMHMLPSRTLALGLDDSISCIVYGDVYQRFAPRIGQRV